MSKIIMATITETLTRRVPVLLEDDEDNYLVPTMVQDAYDTEDIVLTADDYSGVEIEYKEISLNDCGSEPITYVLHDSQYGYDRTCVDCEHTIYCHEMCCELECERYCKIRFERKENN